MKDFNELEIKERKVLHLNRMRDVTEKIDVFINLATFKFKFFKTKIDFISLHEYT